MTLKDLQAVLQHVELSPKTTIEQDVQELITKLLVRLDLAIQVNDQKTNLTRTQKDHLLQKQDELERNFQRKLIDPLTYAKGKEEITALLKAM